MIAMLDNADAPMGLVTLLRSIGRPIAFYPQLARALGGVNEALFVQQLIFWTDKAHEEEGVYKSSEEWEAETFLSYRQQQAVRRRLVKLGVVRERHDRVAHRIYFRVVESKLTHLLRNPIGRRSRADADSLFAPAKTPARPAAKRGAPDKTSSARQTPARRGQLTNSDSLNVNCHLTNSEVAPDYLSVRNRTETTAETTAETKSDASASPGAAAQPAPTASPGSADTAPPAQPARRLRPSETIFCIAQERWNAKWQARYGAPFLWGQPEGATNGNALSRVLGAIGCRRETAKKGQPKLDPDEQRRRHEHNVTLLPKIDTVFDGYLAESHPYYEGHPLTKLATNIQFFHAKAVNTMAGRPSPAFTPPGPRSCAPGADRRASPGTYDRTLSQLRERRQRRELENKPAVEVSA